MLQSRAARSRGGGLRVAAALCFAAFTWFMAAPALAALDVSMSIAPTYANPIFPGDVTAFRITLTNSNSVAPATGVAFTDTLPAGLQVFGGGVVNYSCVSGTGVTSGGQGTITAVVGTGSIALTGGVVPLAQGGGASGRCDIDVEVTSMSPGTSQLNTIGVGIVSGTDNTGAVSNGTQAQQSVTVQTLNPPTLSKSFSTSTVVRSDTVATLTIGISNAGNLTRNLPLNTGADVPAFGLRDILPAGLEVAPTPNASAVCPSGTNPTFAPAAGATTLTVVGGVVAAGGTCTITVDVIGTTAAGTSSSGVYSQPLVNTINRTTDFANRRGLVPTANASATLSVRSAMGLAKSFSPGTVAAGQTANLIITFSNASPNNDISFDAVDALTEAQIDGSASAGSGLLIVGAISNTCGSTVTANGTNEGFTLKGGAIPHNAQGTGQCTVTIPYRATLAVPGTPQTFTNTIPQGGIVNVQSIQSPLAVASVVVVDQLTVTKSVSPATAAPGNPVRYIVTVNNFTAATLTSVKIRDQLPAGMLLLATTPAPPTLGGAACSGLTQDAASTTAIPVFVIATFGPGAGASPASCTVTFWVQSPQGAAAGTVLTNSIVGGDVTGSNGGSPVSNAGGSNTVTTTVGNVITVNKSFSPATSFEGTVSQLTAVFTNIGAQTITAGSFTDALPVGSAGGQLIIASPTNASTTCAGGAVTATAGASSFSVSGATIPARASSGAGANGSCTATVSVIGGAGSYVNTLAAAALTGTQTFADNSTAVATSPGPVSASLTYNSALTASKAFSPSTISTGGISTVTITLGNIGAGTLNNVSVIDPLPAGLVVAPTPTGQTTCGGAPVITAAAGASTATLTGAVIPASGQCTFQFNVRGTGAGAWVNTIPIGNVSATGGVRNVTAVTATLLNSSAGGVSVTNNAAPNSLTSPGQLAVLTITITNGGTVNLSNLSLTDYYTADGLSGGAQTGMINASAPAASTTCSGGLATASSNGTSVSLTNASVAMGTSCTVTVNVTLTTTGTIQNRIPVGAVVDSQGVSNTLATTTSLSASANVGVTKRFTPAVVKPAERSRLQITLINPTAQPLTNLTVTDNLPAGLVVPAGPNPSTTCTGATVSAPTSTQVSVTGGSLPAAAGGVSAICIAEIDVVAAAAGTYNNTIAAGQVTATLNGSPVNNPVPAPATLEVRSPVVIAKAFNPNSVALGAPSQLTITLTNPNIVALTAAALSDTLPANVTVALTPNASTTCAGGVVNAPVSATSILLTGGTIPAGGACNIRVDVVSNVAGVYLNTIPAGALATAQGVTNENPASDTLRIINPPTVSKQFAPTSIPSGGVSVLTIVLGNTNATAATLTAPLIDTLPTSPANIVVGSPNGLGGTCPGATVAAAGAGTVTYPSGAGIPAGGCTIIVNVTGVANGVYTNVIPVGALQTTQGVNLQGANADLTISPLGFVSGRVFRDSNVTPNGVFDGTDTPIAGITVNLTGTDFGANGVAGGGDDSAVSRTTTTDALGNYAFTGLNPGSYTVTEPAQPPGTNNGITTAGTVGGGGGGTAGAATAVGVTPSAVSTVVLLRSGGGAVATSPGNNFAEVAPSSISGQIFLDQDDNGVKNAADTALAGVTVQLLNGANVLVATTLTDASGGYVFSGLAPATYSVREPTQPSGTANGKTLPGGVGNGGAAGTATAQGVIPSLISTLILPPGTSASANDFAEVPAGRQIGGRVFVDTNNDGVFNGGDTGLGGEILNLTGTDFNGLPVSATTNSLSDGRYVFTGLAAGTYTVTQPNQPGSTLNGITTAGSTGGLATALIVTPSVVSSINLTGLNQISSDNNFAEMAAPAPPPPPPPPPAGGVSGTVYSDLNNNGVIDPGEDGIAGVTVTLSGTSAAGTAVLFTTTTAAGGGYSFTGISASNGSGYTITETQPSTYIDGRTTVGGGGPGSPAATKPVASGGLDTISGVVISTTQLTGYNFGETPPGASVSGTVYVDVNNNGVIDPGEIGVGGVTVTLSGTSATGAAVLLTTVTLDAGGYAFVSVPPSNPSGYTITETQPAAYADGRTTVAAGLPGSSTGTKPVISGGPDTITGVVVTTGLFAGYNFGEVPPGASVSGAVYVDANDNGVKDSAETPLSGVTVRLTGTSAAGVAIDRTTVTAGDGGYIFSGLPASNSAGYTITETQPAAYADGRTTVAAGLPGSSTGAKPVISGGPDTITGVVVTSGLFAGYNFGEVPPGASVSGTVYVDANDNGVKDSAETPVSGVTVRLTGTSGVGVAVDRTTVTAGDGGYIFSGLPASNSAGYTITETQPASYLDGRTTVAAGNPGAGAATKPVATGGGDTITGVVVTTAALTNYNFGEKNDGLVSGHVYRDANDNGVREASEDPIAGVTVRLTGTDATGGAVDRTVVTGADGGFAFTGLAQSNPTGYAVSETQPTAYTDGKVTIRSGNPGVSAGGKPIAVGGLDVITGIVLPPRGQLTDYDFGEIRIAATIAGYVYVDANNNGVREANEAPIADVTVRLTGTDITGLAVSLSRVTATDGSFLFSVQPSNAAGYLLTEVQPAGFNDGRTSVAAGNPGSAPSRKPVGVGDNDQITGVVLAAGVALGDYRFGELGIPQLKPPIVNGYVYLDRAHTRVRPTNGTEEGQAGWTVVLRQNGTRICTTTTDANGFYQFDNLHCVGYEISGLPLGSGFSITFSKDGNTMPNVPTSGDNRGDVPSTGGQILNITLGPSDRVVEQNLPLDPAGVIYNAVTRQPVAGATVTIAGPAGFNPATQLVGGAPAVTQTVGVDGLYQFLLQNSFPTGVYTLAVAAPPGYLPAPSTGLPPCANTLTITLAPNPALIQASDFAPGLAVTPQLNPATCPGQVAGGAATTQYFMSFVITNGGSAPILNNHIPLDPILSGALQVTKTTPLVTTARGGLVPYTITAANAFNAPLANVQIRDQLPPGFVYRSGSATRDGAAVTPKVAGGFVTWPLETFAPRQKKTYTLILVVGAGVGDSDYVNHAFVAGATGATISNIAQATVRVTPDPTLDCPDIIGKVFDDRNANGYQDDGEPGIPGVRMAAPDGLLISSDADGRFHVACPATPNPDRGSNYLLKLDERTLPSGFRLTTENPRDVRITRGKMTKLNFGATIHRVVRVELTGAAFADGGVDLAAPWKTQLDALPETLKTRPSIVRIAYAPAPGESADLTRRRIAQVRTLIERGWRQTKGRYALTIEVEGGQ